VHIRAKTTVCKRTNDSLEKGWGNFDTQVCVEELSKAQQGLVAMKVSCKGSLFFKECGI